jgi:hypothetical protein
MGRPAIADRVVDARGASRTNLCWRELAIVAKALADGRDMAEIGLMRDIAQRTLTVLAEKSPREAELRDNEHFQVKY